MMMPVLDPTPAHHLHGHGHQAFYHHEHIPEQAGKMQLTLILPNGVPSVITVDPNTPMMDLLVQATSLNKLNPSSHSLVVLDSNQHIIHFKANQTVGQIVQNCQLPQMNGSSMISLLPKETLHSNPTAKSKIQPFEITVRLQVNLPDGQKLLLRIDPTLPLYEIKEQICKQKKYTGSDRYTLRLPTKLNQPLLLGLSLAEYKTNELTLVYLKLESTDSKNQLQSFDRLYRARSESQPAKETIQDNQQTQSESTNTKHRPSSVQLNPSNSPAQGQNITLSTIRSTRPVTSHTSLHAYWNDPNFDTQSQTSNCSSMTKKRRAPVAPGYISPSNEQQTSSPQSPVHHHQSHESLTGSINGTKQKRKAPLVPPTTSPKETQTNDIINDQSTQTTNIEQEKVHIKPESDDEQLLSNLVVEQQTPISSTQTVTIHTKEENMIETNSPTPIYSEVHKVIKETVSIESPYSTLQPLSTTPIPEEDENTSKVSANYSVNEIVQAGIAEPPSVVSPKKTSKESSPIDGLAKIVQDHNERADIYQKSEKHPDNNVSYFRVAKSRCGKFETDSQGFVNNTSNIFESIDKNQEQTLLSSTSSPLPQQQEQVVKTSEVVTPTRKATSTTFQQPTKGKQAYELLKKYEKEDENQNSPPIDIEYLKTRINEKEKSPTPPIQLEVTERTTHISVTVESDRKQIITRASPIPQQTSSSPTILAPKPFGKTITEYRTVRRIGNDGETTTTTTVHTQTVPSTSTTNNKELSSQDSHIESANSSATVKQESSNEPSQQNDASQNSTQN